jgi:hypothetical protein
MEMTRPKRPKLFKDSELAIWMQSITDKLDPSLNIPYTDNPLPSRPKDRSDRLLPMWM